MPQPLEQDAQLIAFERKFRRFVAGIAILVVAYLGTATVIAAHFVWKFW